LSSAKLRPAIILASAGRDDWILCQVTSNPYADPGALRIEEADFAQGSLQRTSYARPGKLFTANSSLMIASVGGLKRECHQRIVASVVALLQSSIQASRS
jgi:mRNA interferase MazF